MRCYWLLLPVLLITGVAAQAYTLQYKDPVGATRNYQTTMTVKGVATVVGMSLPIDATIEPTATEKVTGTSAGLANCSYMLSNGKVNLKVSGLPGDDGAMGDEVVTQALPTFGYTFARAPSGKTTNVKTVGSLFSLFSGPSDALMNPIENPGGSLEFPNRALNAGDSWTGTDTIPLGGGATATCTENYKLDGPVTVDGKTFLKISSTFVITSTPTGIKTTAEASAGPMKMTLNLAGACTMLFDEAAGELYGSYSTINGAVDMNSEGQGAMATKTQVSITMYTVRTP